MHKTSFLVLAHGAFTENVISYLPNRLYCGHIKKARLHVHLQIVTLPVLVICVAGALGHFLSCSSGMIFSLINLIMWLSGCMYA